MVKTLISIMILMGCGIGIAREVVFIPIESRIKVAILDTGIHAYEKIKPFLCNDSHFDFTDTTIEDQHGHGTNIAASIVEDLTPDKICIRVLKYVSGPGEFRQSTYIKGLRLAVQDKNVRYINISAGGPGRNPEERQLIQEALRLKKYVIVAAGNNREDLNFQCAYYPACYFFVSPYFRVVGSGTDPNHRAIYSNYGRAVTDWIKGDNICAGESEKGPLCFTGTSQATAKLTNYIIKNTLKTISNTGYNK